MILSVGAKGFNYPAWLEIFYPIDMPPEWIVDYYSVSFDCVLLEWSDIASDRNVLSPWINDLSPKFSLFIAGAPLIEELLHKETANLVEKKLPTMAICSIVDKDSHYAENCVIQKLDVKWINAGYENSIALIVSSESNLNDKALSKLLQFVCKQYESYKVVFLFFDKMLNNPSRIKSAQMINELIAP